MTHKDAPPETSSQTACREFWTQAQPHVTRAWGRAKDGKFLAEESRLLHAAWEAAQSAPLARQPEVSEEDAKTAIAVRNAYLADHPGEAVHAMRAALTAVRHNRPAQEKAYRLVGYTSQQVVDQAINGGGVSEASIQPKPFAMASARLYTDTDTWGDPLKADDDQAQEKAEPVVEVVAAESDDGYLIPKHARLLNEAARKLPVGTKLYTAQSAERVREPDWRHIANEFADATCNGIQWLKNVRDGVSSADDAIAEMTENYHRIQALSAAPKTNRHDTPTPPAE